MSSPLYRSRPSGFDIQPASMPDARAINPFIHVSEGLSNAFLVSTTEGRVVINTGMGFESPVHKRNFDAVDSSPTRYILLTQGHVDHVGGVDLFRETDTEVIAQANNQEHQAYDARLFQFRAMRSGFTFAEAIMKATQFMRDNMGCAIPPQSRPVPDITFVDSYAFELGGRSLRTLRGTRWRNHRLDGHLAPGAQDLFCGQSIQCPVRPLSEPGNTSW